MALARHRTTWPSFPLAVDRGASVWDAYRDSHAAVADLLRLHGLG